MLQQVRTVVVARARRASEAAHVRAHRVRRYADPAQNQVARVSRRAEGLDSRIRDALEREAHRIWPDALAPALRARTGRALFARCRRRFGPESEVVVLILHNSRVNRTAYFTGATLDGGSGRLSEAAWRRHIHVPVAVDRDGAALQTDHAQPAPHGGNGDRRDHGDAQI